MKTQIELFNDSSLNETGLTNIAHHIDVWLTKLI